MTKLWKWTFESRWLNSKWLVIFSLGYFCRHNYFAVQRMGRGDWQGSYYRLHSNPRVNSRLAVPVYHFTERMSSVDICYNEIKGISLELPWFYRRSCCHGFCFTLENIGVCVVPCSYWSPETNPHFSPVMRIPWRSGKRGAAPGWWPQNWKPSTYGSRSSRAFPQMIWRLWKTMLPGSQIRM